MKPGTKKFLRYTLTPQVMPRLQGLFYNGFAYIAFYMAQIYRAVRLLPENHPYLSAENMGRFGIRHVIAEAGNNLVIKKENIDQITIFLMMFVGIVLLFVQLFMLFFAGFVEIAHAGGALLYPSSSPLDFFSYFNIPDATNELAFVLLDRVFGIPGVAGPVGTSFFTDEGGGYTCVVTGQPCFTALAESSSSRILLSDNVINTTVAPNPSPDSYSLIPQAPFTMTFPWPYHEAFRGMLQVYSVGLLVIGVFIFLYFMFAIAAETTQTGTAFGRRFNHIWAPLRIVFAMGLLVPITYGLNPGQWFLMYMVKWGSSFATNGWIIYNNAVAGEETMLGPADTVVAIPNAPPINTLMEFGSILATCLVAYERLYHERPTRAAVTFDAWLINPNDLTIAPLPLMGTSFREAIEYFDGGMIHVRFGELRVADSASQTWDGQVAPWCGELTLDLTYVPENLAAATGAMTEPGSYFMLYQYYTLIRLLWMDAADVGGGAGWNPMPAILFNQIGEIMADRHISLFNNHNSPLPTTEELGSLYETYQEFVDFNITQAVQDQAQSTEWAERLTDLGWGGAAIWYNKVAQLNGGMVSAVYSMPAIKKYPYVMEEVLKKRASSDDGVSGGSGRTFHRSTDAPIAMGDDEEEELVKAMSQAKAIWSENYSEKPESASAFLDAINAIFGTQGLFDIVANDAQDIHPLAQLASIGRSIVDSAIRNLGYSTAAGLGGGLANLFQQHQIGSFAGAASSFFFQVAMIGLTLGFVLFYIIPFLPFIYFFFAVGGWVKAIFEAMVGVPLWALAHIRIDGDGLPGSAAMGGYYLILEIFLRPILTIFGFIASIMIFTAQVQVLHAVWDLVVPNVSGSHAATAGATIEFVRNAVDEFFFTIIYAIMCYMMAMASFKLIDQVPNHILRWMGASVQTFGEQHNDPAQNLVRNSFLGGNMVANPLKQAAGAGRQALGQGSQALGELTGRSS